MEVIEFIKKWQLSYTFLADKIGMKRSTFYNKMSDKQPPVFNENEVYQLKMVLVEIYEDLYNMSFNFKID